jgi:hypothetical protein
MISQFARCAGVASDSRQDQASGTLITRPSAKYAVIVSSVTSTRRIVGSAASAALMPCLDDEDLMLNDYPSDLIVRRRAERANQQSQFNSQQQFNNHKSTIINDPEAAR